MKALSSAGALVLASVLPSAIGWSQTAPETAQATAESVKLENFVVTASGVAESLAAVPQTIAVFDKKDLKLERPQSAVDFFSENAIGFAAPIAPGHAYLSLRGAITNQIGYDDASEIAVLINGRRAGTDNLSKLSTFDAQSIEVLRGPSSVIYGSSAIGGVVNVILKDGRNTPGTRTTASYGSFERFTGSFETGGKSGKWDYYAGFQFQSSGDYKTGKNSPGNGTLINTAYKRRTGNVTLGYALTPETHVSLVLRTDGLYDVGHRGVTYSYTDHDDRYNDSAELKFDGTLGTSGSVHWNAQTYFARDSEVWYWSQDPLLAPFSNPVVGNKPGIIQDDNTRRNYALGERLSLTYSANEYNTLLAGLDLEYNYLRSHRIRKAAPGYVEGWQPAPLTNPTVKTSPVDIAPLAYNYDAKTIAPYVEDALKFLDGKWIIKFGTRFDLRQQHLVHTQNEVAPFNTAQRTFDAFTYRVGTTYKAAEWLTLKANVGSGFRAPNPNELYGYSFSGNGVVSIGNANLRNERSVGWEVGFTAAHDGFSSDLTYFSSDIENRIVAFVNGPATAANGYTTTVGANLAHATTDGIEYKVAYDLAPAFGLQGYKIEPYASGNYLFNFTIEDPVYKALNNDLHIPRVNRYQTSLGVRAGKKNKWDASVFAVFSGSTYEGGGTHGLINANYPTNPNTGLPITTWIFKKDPYWLLHARFSYDITPQVRVFGGVNNALDLNYDPSFLALNEVNAKYTVNIYKSQSRTSTGSSAPGRELFLGVEYAF